MTSVAFSRSFSVGDVITAALERGAEDRGAQSFLTTNLASDGATAEEDEVLICFIILILLNIKLTFNVKAII